MSAREPVSTTEGIPLAEFMRLYEQEGPFEFVNGERVPLLPGVAEHSEIIKLLYQLLLAHESERQSQSRCCDPAGDKTRYFRPIRQAG